jgi:hypothetical protein
LPHEPSGRHRFKTVGIESGIEHRILDAIQGHRPRNAAEGYGEVTNEFMTTAVELQTKRDSAISGLGRSMMLKKAMALRRHATIDSERTIFLNRCCVIDACLESMLREKPCAYREPHLH